MVLVGFVLGIVGALLCMTALVLDLFKIVRRK